MLTVFIPAYNEETRIGPTLDTVLRAAAQSGCEDIEILVVNDGSSDRTGEIIDGYMKVDSRVRPLHNETNQGIGSSFIRSLGLSTKSRFLIVPGDNDTPFDMLVKIMQHCGKAEVTLGFWLNREERGRFRNVVSQIFNTAYMLSFNIFVQYLNGPTVYPTEKLKALKLRSKKFSICAESTIKLLRSGCTFSELSGYMQTGIEGSGSIRFSNLVEVALTFLGVLYDIHVKDRHFFNFRPRRVRLD